MEVRRHTGQAKAAVDGVEWVEQPRRGLRNRKVGIESRSQPLRAAGGACSGFQQGAKDQTARGRVGRDSAVGSVRVDVHSRSHRHRRPLD